MENLVSRFHKMGVNCSIMGALPCLKEDFQMPINGPAALYVQIFVCLVFSFRYTSGLLRLKNPAEKNRVSSDLPVGEACHRGACGGCRMLYRAGQICQFTNPFLRMSVLAELFPTRLPVDIPAPGNTILEGEVFAVSLPKEIITL